MRKPAYLPSDQQCGCGCGYPAAPGRKYMNDSHQDMVNNRRYREKRRVGQHARVCPVCGVSFVTKYEKKICCSKQHADIHWRQQHPESERLISARQVQAEEKQLEFVATARPQLIGRPECGPRCTCGKVLYYYELHLGRCMPCQTKRIRTGAYVLAQLAAGD